MANVPILNFNSGEASPQIDARSDVEKYSSLCRHLENMLPRIYGGAERRPGTYYITTSYGSAQIVRMIPFIYSATVAYELEFGNLFIRALYNDAVVTTITSPYLTADLFQLQYRQVGDVMWLVHPSYAQRKLTRTSATEFSLDEIDFRKGPFLVRNDLLDPNVSDTAFMKPNISVVGGEGTLHCEDSNGADVVFFSSTHLGALFKLLQPREDTAITQEGAGTSSSLIVKGTFRFITHGTWTGTVKLQRRENSSASSDWETYGTYISKNDYNAQITFSEEADNVEYRIYSVGVTGSFSANITVSNSTQEGIVKVIEYVSTSTVRIEVLKALASTNATRRWAEGAWSDYKGFPTSVTFVGGRCVYAGSSVIPAQAT